MSVSSRMDLQFKTLTHPTKPNTEATLQFSQTPTQIEKWFLQAISSPTFPQHRRIGIIIHTPQCHMWEHPVMIRIITTNTPASLMFHPHHRLSILIAKMNSLVQKHSSQHSTPSTKTAIAICHFRITFQIM